MTDSIILKFVDKMQLGSLVEGVDQREALREVTRGLDGLANNNYICYTKGMELLHVKCIRMGHSHNSHIPAVNKGSLQGQAGARPAGECGGLKREGGVPSNTITD